MLASLGRGFRKKARKGGVTAVVVRGNRDGSLKVTESRVLSASDLVSTVLRVSLSWTVGFMGLFSTLRGAKEEARAARARKGHAGSGEQPFAFHRLAHADRGDDLWKMRIAKPRCAPDRWTHA